MKDPKKLFDFIDILFTDKKTFNKLKSYEKARHFFMLNRFMSIQYPVQSNFLQHLKINPVEVVNYWQTTMNKLYTRVPNWMYVKTKKQKNNNKKYYIDEEIIKEYCKKFNYSKRQVEDAMKFFPEKMYKELKQFEKLLKQ